MTLWALAHAERAALAEDLSGIDTGQWRHETLCDGWDVEDVVAHLVGVASGVAGNGQGLRAATQLVVDGRPR